MTLEFTDAYEAALACAMTENISIGEAEKHFFAENHAALGGVLAEKWRFPTRLTEAILYHHTPQSAKAVPVETAIVHFADILIKARGLGFSGDHIVPLVNEAAFDILQLAEQDIIEILQKVEDMVEATEEILI
jgi:HD-like signal output (HDOD) protein